MTDSLLKYFHMLYDQIHFPVQVINNEGKIVYVNQAFAFQWGYNLSELNEYIIFNDSELKNSGSLEIILNTFDKKNYSFINNYADSLLKSKEITIPIFRTKIFYVTFENKDYVVLFHEDQTEMVLTEAEIKKARDGNKEAERLKDTFLTVLSHELRTPLNIVLGYASIIKDSMKDKISTEDKVYLDNLYSGSERLYNSITQMLEFAQIEAGNFTLNLETIELRNVVKNCIDINKKLADAKNLEINTKYINRAIWVDVDVQSLENALNNILNNALKFTQRGFVEVETDILDDKDLAVCRVRDSGVGITPQYLDHLFRPFSQEDLNIGRNYEGNGLGLALAKRYIEKMGGSLLVDSIKGVGSTFTVTLPLSVRVSKSSISTAETGTNLKKILLLDDMSESYALLSAYLKNYYQIEIHNIKSYKNSIVDKSKAAVIIVDIDQLNWADAVKLSRNLKKNDNRKRPVIVLASEYTTDKIGELSEAGVNKLITKPVLKDDIMNALKEILP